MFSHYTTFSNWSASNLNSLGIGYTNHYRPLDFNLEYTETIYLFNLRFFFSGQFFQNFCYILFSYVRYRPQRKELVYLSLSRLVFVLSTKLLVICSLHPIDVGKPSNSLGSINRTICSFLQQDPWNIRHSSLL